MFGKIDREKAAKGKELFAANCAECHNSYPYTWTEPNKYGKRFIEVGLVPEKYVGTDPMQFEDLRPYVLTAQLAAICRTALRIRSSSRRATSISFCRRHPRYGAE